MTTASYPLKAPCHFPARLFELLTLFNPGTPLAIPAVLCSYKEKDLYRANLERFKVLVLTDVKKRIVREGGISFSLLFMY